MWFPFFLALSERFLCLSFCPFSLPLQDPQDHGAVIPLNHDELSVKEHGAHRGDQKAPEESPRDGKEEGSQRDQLIDPMVGLRLAHGIGDLLQSMVLGGEGGRVVGQHPLLPAADPQEPMQPLFKGSRAEPPMRVADPPFCRQPSHEDPEPEVIKDGKGDDAHPEYDPLPYGPAVIEDEAQGCHQKGGGNDPVDEGR